MLDNSNLKWMVIAGTVLLTLYFTRFLNSSINLRENPERRFHLVASYLLGSAIFAFSAWRSNQEIAQTALYAAALTCVLMGIYNGVKNIEPLPIASDPELDLPLRQTPDAETELEERLKRVNIQKTTTSNDSSAKPSAEATPQSPTTTQTSNEEQ